ncbi:hypothetical protein ACPEGA_23875, partial [Escherichia coli]|uniref:hypothetical protein n=1 Tax=Escherichia coli TaxID=562 RepID=UPI003C303169
SLTFTDKMTYIIETPFSHIPAAFVVALRNPATKVESMAIFLPPANLQWISPAGFLFLTLSQPLSVKGCCNAAIFFYMKKAAERPLWFIDN